MAIYKTTRGYTGSFSVFPTRVKQIAPDGSKVYTRSLRIPVTRLGIDANTKLSQGMVDTDHLPPATVEAARFFWPGDDWKQKLEAKLDKTDFLKRAGSVEELKQGISAKKGIRVVVGTRTIANRKPISRR